MLVVEPTKLLDRRRRAAAGEVAIEVPVAVEVGEGGAVAVPQPGKVKLPAGQECPPAPEEDLDRVPRSDRDVDRRVVEGGREGQAPTPGQLEPDERPIRP